MTGSPPEPAPELLEDSAEDLFEDAPCGYLTTLPGGRIVRVNRTFLTWTGYAAGQLLGTRFQDLLTAGGRIFHETHYAPLLSMQGTVREIAVDMVRADGTLLPALVNSVLRRDAAGAPAVVRTTVFNATDRRRYEQELLRARRVAEEAAERSRLLAQTLQESLIPPALPAIPGTELAAVYRPAGRGDEVGGDFYDVFEAGRDDWALVIGDVCGKGAAAAVVTVVARHAARTGAVRSRRPRSRLEHVNAELLEREPPRFCSVAYGRLRPGPTGAWRLTVSAGGHPLPLLARGPRPPRSLGRPGTVLGVLPAPRLHDVTIELRAGDVVLFFTDGVTEARHGDDFYGDERLAAALAALRGEEAGVIAERLGAEVVAFQGGHPRDDIALMVLKVGGPPA